MCVQTILLVLFGLLLAQDLLRVLDLALVLLKAAARLLLYEAGDLGDDVGALALRVRIPGGHNRWFAKAYDTDNKLIIIYVSIKSCIEPRRVECKRFH